jgi:pSer/pThr/pTyr-binding forkhead associated (FHA) protein
MAKFVVFYNGEPQKTYELDEPVISIGRLPENTISIPNMGVSRRHVKIEEDPDRKYLLVDLNSLNGTFVNGKRVKKILLSSGDKITIGKFTILYEENGKGSSLEGSEQIPRGISIQNTDSIVSPLVKTKVPPLPQHTQPVTLVAPGQEKESTAVLIETNKHVVYKLDKPYMTIGSGEEDDVFVSGFMIGEGQAMVELQEDGILLSASKLMGKIKVNGKSIRSHFLQHKDRVEIGSSTFRFMENG